VKLTDGFDLRAALVRAKVYGVTMDQARALVGEVFEGIRQPLRLRAVRDGESDDLNRPCALAKAHGEKVRDYGEYILAKRRFFGGDKGAA